MKVLRLFILCAIIISLCLGNEVFTNYSLNQNLALESMPTQPVPQKVPFGVTAAEFGGGLLVGAGGAIIGGVGARFVTEKFFGAERIYDSEAILFWEVLGGCVLATLGSARMTYIVGNAFRQNGRFVPTLSGAALGTVVGGGTVLLSSQLHSHSLFIAGLVSTAVLTPVGAIIGYNLSQPKPVKQAFLYQHFQNLAFESIPVNPAPRGASAGRIIGQSAIIFTEFIGSIIGGVGLAIVGGLMGESVSKPEYYGPPGPLEIREEVAIGLAVGWIFGCPGGTWLVGSAFRQRGRFLSSFLGGALGAGICAGVVAFNELRDPRWGSLLLIPTGAVIGYNLSRPKPVKQAFLYQHLDLPAFSFRTEKTKENKIIPVYDLRLVNARF